MTNQATAVAIQTDHPLVEEFFPPGVEGQVRRLMNRKAYEHARDFVRGRAVLDWGCNDGYGLRILRGATPEVAGLDTNERSVAAARLLLPQRAAWIRFYDGLLAPFPADFFDVVVSFQVIEHVCDVRAYLDAIGGVLRPGGVALFTTPNRLLRLDDGMKPWNRYHCREYEAGELRSVLDRHFSVVEMWGMQGVDGVDEVERRRCARLKARHRRKTSLYGRVRLWLARRARPLLRRFPSSRAWAAFLEPWPPTPPDETAWCELAGIGTPEGRPLHGGQLFYEQANLRSAIDLLAVCVKAPCRDRHEPRR